MLKSFYRSYQYRSKTDAITEFFVFIIDCICIIISYVLASYLQFGNLWGGYTKGIVLLRMGILLMSITLIYFVMNPNRKFFNRSKKQEENNSWNMNIQGLVLVDSQYEEEIAGVKVVCGYADMMEYVRKNAVDEVFVHLPSQIEIPIKNSIKELETMGIMVDLNINVFELFFKRLMDIVGAVIGLIITAIVTVFLAPVLLIESPGLLFFSQIQIGKNGRRFRIYKFRSMYIDAEERKKELMAQNEMEGLMFKMENDPRVTKVGHFIRKTSIDELPQFWNILKGEMSLVGTRLPTEEFLQYEGYHRRRLSATPGLTGLWQVSGRSNTKNFEEIVAMDVEYIDNWFLKEDIKILFKTVGVVLGGKGAS